MSNILDKINAASLRDDIPAFRPGDTLDVEVKVIEGNNQRTQLFKGVCIRRQGAGVSETFTVRKVSFGIGVERTFPSTLSKPGVHHHCSSWTRSSCEAVLPA